MKSSEYHAQSVRAHTGRSALTLLLAILGIVLAFSSAAFAQPPAKMIGRYKDLNWSAPVAGPHNDFKFWAGNRYVVVPMPDGGDLVYDYWDTAKDPKQGAFHLTGRTFQAELLVLRKNPALRAAMSASERQLLDTVSMRVALAPHLAIVATKDATGAPIIVANSGVSMIYSEFAILAGALVSSNKMEQEFFKVGLEHAMLSETDLALKRGRWFNSPRLRWYYELPPQTEQESLAGQGILYSMVQGVLMHEICHHLKGHVARSVGQEVVDRNLPLTEASKAQVSRARELAADRCAAVTLAKAGLDFRTPMLLSLLHDILVVRTDANSHPSLRERLAAIRDVSESLQQQSGASAAQIAESRAQFNNIDEVLTRVGPTLGLAKAKLVVDGFQRGTWPTCPWQMSGVTNCKAAASSPPN